MLLQVGVAIVVSRLVVPRYPRQPLRHAAHPPPQAVQLTCQHQYFLLASHHTQRVSQSNCVWKSDQASDVRVCAAWGGSCCPGSGRAAAGRRLGWCPPCRPATVSQPASASSIDDIKCDFEQGKVEGNLHPPDYSKVEQEG